MLRAHYEDVWLTGKLFETFGHHFSLQILIHLCGLLINIGMSEPSTLTVNVYLSSETVLVHGRVCWHSYDSVGADHGAILGKPYCCPRLSGVEHLRACVCAGGGVLTKVIWRTNT